MADRTLIDRDLEYIWHPYTQMKGAANPLPIIRGEGARLIAEDGRSYIDAISSWWVNIHGHGHPYIAEKIFDQLKRLEHIIFAGFTHPTAVELAERLLAIVPQNQAKVFYSDNGSTAVEVALKMCFQYWSNLGQPRKQVIAFNNSYHGDTFGAMAVSARSAFTRAFDDLLFEVKFIDLPSPGNLENLIRIISDMAPDTAAFIFEPLVQGAGGMQMYDAASLDKLLSTATESGVLLIADEVMTGFGRTGKMFASDHLSTRPDIMCFSKGLTGGTMALGATSCSQRIFDAFLSDDKFKTLFHGHSFTANPVACSAALASLDLFEMEDTFSRIARISLSHERFMSLIRNHPRLKDVRHQGTILAIEWDTALGSSYFNDLRDGLYGFFLSKGIILRPLGNIIYILPPYCITEAELQEVYSAIEEALLIF